MENTKNQFLIGYRDPSIKLYRTKLKPVGYIVATLGLISLTIALIPNGLGIIFYSLAILLLESIGINIYNYKRKLIRKLNYIKLRYF